MGKLMFNDKCYTGSAGSDYHTYSTAEKVVGEWIDGSTIYEKTIYASNVAGVVADWASLEAIADVDEVISLEGCSKSRTNGQFTGAGYYIQFCFVNGYVKYFSDAFTNTNLDLYVTIRYTKTAS